jgi:hypothetical protein
MSVSGRSVTGLGNHTGSGAAVEPSRAGALAGVTVPVAEMGRDANELR